MLKQIEIADFSKTILFIFTIISAIIIFYTIYIFNFGFDFTDEAYYLQFTTYPSYFKTSMQQFGFIYHFIFKLFNFNIQLLRSFNFILLLFLSFIFNYLYLNLLLNEKVNNKVIITLLSIILSLTILPIYTLWIPSPNYNFLNFKAILLTFIGLFLVSNKERKNKYFYLGWVLIGLGGGLSFLAKPTTAAILSLLVIFWVYYNNRANLKFLLIPIFLSFFILYLSAQFIDGSVNLFINRYVQILYEDKIAEIHDSSSLFAFSINDLYIYVLKKSNILFFLITFLIGFILSKYTNNIVNLKIFIISIFCLICLFIFIVTYDNFRFYSFSAGHLIWAPTFGALVQALSQKKGPRPDLDQRLNSSRAIILGLLPLAYGFGSNNSFIITTAFSACFFLLSIFTLLRRFHEPKDWLCQVIGLSVCSLTLSAGILYASFANPYRQPVNLWENNFPISLQKGFNAVYLNPLIGDYVLTLQKLTENNGFIPQSLFIDLSGRMPGVPYVVQGIPPGTAWLGAGNQGLQEVFRLNLKKTSCQELVKAWMLWDTKPSRTPLNPSALLEHGIDPENDYAPLGTVKYPIFLPNGTVYFKDHIILKPKTDYTTLLKSCINSRKINN